MSMDEASGRTYSDTWHRVASVRACLRSPPLLRFWTFLLETQGIVRGMCARHRRE